MIDADRLNDWKISTDDGIFINVQKLEQCALDMQRAMVKFVIQFDNGNLDAEKTTTEFRKILNI